MVTNDILAKLMELSLRDNLLNHLRNDKFFAESPK